MPEAGELSGKRTRKKLGEMLVDAGYLTEERLTGYVAAQKRSGLKLGQFLIREGVVSESMIVDLVSRQAGIQRFDPAEFPVTMELAKSLAETVSRKYGAVPLRRGNHLLLVAMTDPLDIRSLDAIEDECDLEVEPVICTEQEFSHLFTQVYGTRIDGFAGEGYDLTETMDYGEDEEPADAGATEISSLQHMAEEAPVVRLVNALLAQAVRQGASDIHISPEKRYVQVRLRVDGVLHEVPAPPKTLFLSIVSRLKILANLDISVSRIPQDGRFTVKIENKEINIRVSTIPTIYGENVVLRLLDTSGGVYTLDQLGMASEDQEKLKRNIQKPYGMILATGPTGSGKSTSLFAMINRINKPDINIITLEDPVEYRIEKIRQAQLNRRAGMTFASGLRSILRQDPDVIMVGEIRDGETAQVATQAALTGHMVFSTVHTNDAAGAITRFIDMGVEPFLVSSVMLVSMAQRLVRKVCEDCAEPYQPPHEALVFMGLENAKKATFKRGKGCAYCMNTGYRGRTGIYEILEIDDDVREMIVSRATSHQITRAAVTAGKLQTLKQDAARKAALGITTVEEAAKGVMG
ncbi:GspE/PulE family protein [Desulfosudis oleivorans]|uniref:Type II secretion system protein E n=1 Tax=Desulfosudis oleivorans (strain DSM 6200 / JCM 39069 / Hxd3) TaxID=96561 RepID=A8ZYV7_DESOH|nr:GspE/PulE family protein [Desulfosudis oleivorans]ABW67212.1 type II secretion system protein E [Desulfosudis oleivorans Hxd3]